MVCFSSHKGIHVILQYTQCIHHHWLRHAIIQPWWRSAYTTRRAASQDSLVPPRCFLQHYTITTCVVWSCRNGSRALPGSWTKCHVGSPTALILLQYAGTTTGASFGTLYLPFFTSQIWHSTSCCGSHTQSGVVLPAVVPHYHSLSPL